MIHLRGYKMREELRFSPKEKLLVRKCHMCGQLIESSVEQKKCLCCGKAFLPLNYFAKIHNHEQAEFSELFAESHDITDEDLIKGIYVLW
jgi:hypothetical protein